MAQVLNVTDDTFEGDVLKAQGPVLVDFWAAWCMPCRKVAPVVEAIAEEYVGKLQVAKMDVDANPATPQRYGIQGIPTLILFKDGEAQTRVIGYHAKDALEESLLPYIE